MGCSALVSALVDTSMDELSRAIAREPLEASLHRALYELLMRRRELDRAWCTAATLVWLGAADREQQAIHRQLRPHGAPAFKARLGPGDWLRVLRHPDLDLAVGGVFEVLARPARALKGARPRGTRELPSATQNLAAKAFFGAANVLGLGSPELYVRSDQHEPIVALPTAPAASVLGAPLLSGWSVPELMFVFGKHLVVHQGEHAVRAAFPLIRELSTLLAASLQLVSPARPATTHVLRLRDALGRELSASELARLRDAAATLSALDYERDLEAHVTRWLHASQRTAVRAGLLLCGDPAVAARWLATENVAPGDLPPTAKLAELVSFGVSEAHHSLRRALGIAVDADGPTKTVAFDDEDEPTRDRALCA